MCGDEIAATEQKRKRTMKRNQKIVAGGTALILALGLGLAAVGTSSAYFSDTNSGGSVVVSAGSIYVDTDGNPTNTSDIMLDNVLPGETATGDFTAKNTGQSTQDLYVQFKAGGVLEAINELGTTATIEITVNDEQVFYSDNLNDEYPGDPSVTPLPETLLLAEDVAPGESIHVEFSFTLDADFVTQPGETWDEYATAKLPYSVIATQPGIEPGA